MRLMQRLREIVEKGPELRTYKCAAAAAATTTVAKLLHQESQLARRQCAVVREARCCARDRSWGPCSERKRQFGGSWEELWDGRIAETTCDEREGAGRRVGRGYFVGKGEEAVLDCVG